MSRPTLAELRKKDGEYPRDNGRHKWAEKHSKWFRNTIMKPRLEACKQNIGRRVELEFPTKVVGLYYTFTGEILDARRYMETISYRVRLDEPVYGDTSKLPFGYREREAWVKRKNVKRMLKGNQREARNE